MRIPDDHNLNSPGLDDDLSPAGVSEHDKKQSAIVMSLHGLGGPEELPEADDLQFDESRPGLKNVSQSTLLLILVVLIAAGALYAMRASHGDMGSNGMNSAVEAKIEQALAKLTRPEALRNDDPLLTQNLTRLFRDTDAIIEIFAVDPSEQQVPAAQLKKNPFRVHTVNTADLLDDPDANARAAERERAKLKKQLIDEYKTLKLQSVVAGRMPIAMINNNMHREGDALGSFTVRKIRTTELAVELFAHDMIFVLRMKSSSNKDGLRRDMFRPND